MIRVDIYVKEYNWNIHAFFAVSEYYVDEIMDMLWNIDCNSDTALKAFENMTSGRLNTGFCYSNYAQKESVMVVAKTTSAAQFANSLHHELVHLQSHIGKAFYLEPTSEDVAYLSGEIMMTIYPKIKHLLCDCCRYEKKKNKMHNEVQ